MELNVRQCSRLHELPLTLDLEVSSVVRLNIRKFVKDFTLLYIISYSLLFLSSLQHAMRTWSKVMSECNTYGRH